MIYVKYLYRQINIVFIFRVRNYMEAVGQLEDLALEVFLHTVKKLRCVKRKTPSITKYFLIGLIKILVEKQFNDAQLLIVMEKTGEDTYISDSKLDIDNYIRKNEYRKAFALFILFLERLNGEEIAQVIDYYSKNMQALGVFNNTFPSR